jgi:hypothetical protein
MKPRTASSESENLASWTRHGAVSRPRRLDAPPGARGLPRYPPSTRSVATSSKFMLLASAGQDEGATGEIPMRVRTPMSHPRRCSALLAQNDDPPMMLRHRGRQPYSDPRWTSGTAPLPNPRSARARRRPLRTRSGAHGARSRPMPQHLDGGSGTSSRFVHHHRRVRRIFELARTLEGRAVLLNPCATDEMPEPHRGRGGAA